MLRYWPGRIFCDCMMTSDDSHTNQLSLCSGGGFRVNDRDNPLQVVLLCDFQTTQLLFCLRAGTEMVLNMYLKGIIYNVIFTIIPFKSMFCIIPRHVNFCFVCVQVLIWIWGSRSFLSSPFSSQQVPTLAAGETSGCQGNQYKSTLKGLSDRNSKCSILTCKCVCLLVWLCNLCVCVCVGGGLLCM